MGLNDVRTLAKTTIQALPAFAEGGTAGAPERVYTSPLRNYNGLAPLVILTLSGHEQSLVARSSCQWMYTFDLDLLVRSEPGQEQASEDTHGAVLETIKPALADAGFTVERTDGTPRGNPLITSEDGYTYRYSRTTIRYTE